MKKPLILTTVATLALLISGGLTLAISSANAANTHEDNLVAISDNSSGLNLFNQLSPQDENVYIITDTTGAASKTFINSTLSTNQETLPITLHIDYSLNGSPISASDLAGQSGHVKITFHYTATQTYQGKLVPFLTATGLQLDNTKFSNVKLNNGKILSEDNGYTILGYSLAGLNENLDTDLLPDTFTIEADVTNFELGNSYTFATNDLIADLDTSKLSTIDDIASAINQLSDGFDQIITGSTKLDNGLDTLVAGITKLQSGAADLNNGANQLATGISKLSAGLSTLSENSDALITGATQTFDGLLTNVNKTISANPTLLYIINTYQISFPLTIENYNSSLSTLIEITHSEDLTTAKTSLDSYNKFYTGLIAYTTGVSDAVTGATQLTDGANTLVAGTVTLKTGVDQLAAGSQQLSSGSKALNSGLQTFKASGIDRLVNFANHDLANFTTNLLSSVNAARSYHSYSGTNAKSVKFIFKTPSIK